MFTLQALIEYLKANLMNVDNKARFVAPPWCANPSWRPTKRDDYPDFIVRDPGASVLLEIKAAELVPTTAFATSHTARFPRVVRIRYDKPVSDCECLPPALLFG